MKECHGYAAARSSGLAPEQTFLQLAAKVSKEPKITNASGCMNVSFLEVDQIYKKCQTVLWALCDKMSSSSE